MRRDDNETHCESCTATRRHSHSSCLGSQRKAFSAQRNAGFAKAKWRKRQSHKSGTESERAGELLIGAKQTQTKWQWECSNIPFPFRSHFVDVVSVSVWSFSSFFAPWLLLLGRSLLWYCEGASEKERAWRLSPLFSIYYILCWSLHNCNCNAPGFYAALLGLTRPPLCVPFFLHSFLILFRHHSLFVLIIALISLHFEMNFNVCLRLLPLSRNLFLSRLSFFFAALLWCYYVTWVLLLCVWVHCIVVTVQNFLNAFFICLGINRLHRIHIAFREIS